MRVVLAGRGGGGPARAAGGARGGRGRVAAVGRRARALAALPEHVLGPRRVRPRLAHVPLRRLLDAEPAGAARPRRHARLR